MAEDEGFEPPQTESESGVLPLHKSSIAGTFIIIRTFQKMSRTFFKKLKIFVTLFYPVFYALFLPGKRLSCQHIVF